MTITITVFPIAGGQEGVDSESGAGGQRSEIGRRLLDDAEPAPFDSQLTVRGEGSGLEMERREGGGLALGVRRGGAHVGEGGA
jgi:hypothetical protein